MKNRLLPILLSALLLSSALVGCTRTKTNGDDPDPQQQTDPTTTDTGDNRPTTGNEWIEMNETVFVTTDKLIIRVEANNFAETVDRLDLMTKLTRTAVSSDGKWSRILYNGASYYTLSADLTNADLTGERFADGEPYTMYVTTNCNVRMYASSDNRISAVVGELEAETPVTVFSNGSVSGASWSKVSMIGTDNEEHFYFINSKFLTSKKPIDYATLFTPCAETTYYTTVKNLNVRTAPEPDDSVGLIVDTLQGFDQQVTVVAKGTESYNSWARIKYADEVKEGDTQTYSYYYVSLNFLSLKPSPKTLAEFLEQNPDFEKVEPAQTMYITKTTDFINVRSKPNFDSQSIVAMATPLTAKSAITVIAKGRANDADWAVFQSEGKFLFISASSKYLTTDPNGEPILNPDQIIRDNHFTALSPEKTVYSKALTNLYTTPSQIGTPSKKLQKGDAVVAIAEGSSGGIDWYLIKIDDFSFFFAGKTLFSDTNPIPPQ